MSLRARVFVRLLCASVCVSLGCGASPEEPAPPRPQLATSVAGESPPSQALAPSAAVIEARSAEPLLTASPAPLPLPEPGSVVLHVGDSFVHSGLTQRLREHFEPLGLRYEVRAEHSTNSLDWAKRVPALVSATQPDLVIITLGGNEIGSKHLDVQARAIGRIVAAIGKRPCVWTTPPLWMQESGLFDTIAKSVSPCRFFETDRVIGKFLPRRADKIHPTAEGGAMWADGLYAWLLAERNGEGPWSLRPSPESELRARGLRGPLPH